MKKMFGTMALALTMFLVALVVPMTAYAAEPEPNIEPAFNQLSLSTFSEDILSSSANVTHTFYQNGFLITEHPWETGHGISLSSLPYTYEKYITWTQVGTNASGFFYLIAYGQYHTNSTGGLYFIVDSTGYRGQGISVGYLYLTLRTWCTGTDNKGHYEYRIAASSAPSTGLGGGANGVSFPP